MSTTEPPLEYPDSYETSIAILSGVAAIVSLIITSVHSYKVYQDLYTAERKSLDHRRSKPKIDAGYKKVTRLTYVTACLYSLALVGSAIDSNFNKSCHVRFTLVGVLGFWWAKTGLYLTYILRLHQVYGPSAYGYRKGTMICWAVTIVVCCASLFIVHETANLRAPVFRDDGDNKYPYFCQIDTGEPYVIIMGAGAGLFEIIASIGSICAFIIPLNKVVKATRSDEDEQSKKRAAKIMYAGYKYKVLVVSSAIVTLSWLVLFIIGQETVGGLVWQADMVFNPVCLLLMTAYYPNDLYYQRLCCICIRCCDPKGKSYKSAATTNEPRASGVKSLDTSRAVEHGAASKRESGTYQDQSAQRPSVTAPDKIAEEMELTPAPTDSKPNVDSDAATNAALQP